VSRTLASRWQTFPGRVFADEGKRKRDETEETINKEMKINATE
jgi:hypothetical protein